MLGCETAPTIYPRRWRRKSFETTMRRLVSREGEQSCSRSVQERMSFEELIIVSLIYSALEHLSPINDPWALLQLLFLSRWYEFLLIKLWKWVDASVFYDIPYIRAGRPVAIYDFWVRIEMREVITHCLTSLGRGYRETESLRGGKSHKSKIVLLCTREKYFIDSKKACFSKSSTFGILISWSSQNVIVGWNRKNTKPF